MFNSTKKSTFFCNRKEEWTTYPPMLFPLFQSWWHWRFSVCMRWKYVKMCWLINLKNSIWTNSNQLFCNTSGKKKYWNSRAFHSKGPDRPLKPSGPAFPVKNVIRWIIQFFCQKWSNDAPCFLACFFSKNQNIWEFCMNCYAFWSKVWLFSCVYFWFSSFFFSLFPMCFFSIFFCQIWSNDHGIGCISHFLLYLEKTCENIVQTIA